MNYIGFNEPYLTGKEITYLHDAVASKWISGNGKYTKLCQNYLESKFGYKKCLLTTSCTDALEMCAILIDIQPGDEVIMPSYTFVSTANAFVLRGAKVVFADSSDEHPNMDVEKIESLITSKTKAIIPVHYAGMGCDMEALKRLVDKHDLYLIEDAAQAINSYHKGKPLGSYGHLATFSFHETKNISAGEGGALIINDERFVDRAEIIWEKGTNRTAFMRGEVDKYGWVDIGSSFLPSELIAAFLFAQFEQMEKIQEQRLKIWQFYSEELTEMEQQGLLSLPTVPEGNTNNAHMFFLVTKDGQERDALIKHLRALQIHAVSHYISLHSSDFYKELHDGRVLTFSDMYTDRLVRLPMHYHLRDEELQHIVKSVKIFYS